jgi:hypothetical protein
VKYLEINGGSDSRIAALINVNVRARVFIVHVLNLSEIQCGI